MDGIKETIAKNILFYRKKHHLSQKELGAKVGVSNAAISNWENGTNSIDIETLYDVCMVLQIDFNTVFGIQHSENSDVFRIPDNVGLELSDHEAKVIKAYREKPEMQSSVDKLLDINKDDKLKSLSMKELLEANRLEDAPRYGVTAAATGNNEKFLVSKENEIEAKKILDDIHNQKLD